MSLTRADLRTLAWDYLDDPNGGYFTAAVMNMRLNLAQKEVQKNLISANKQYYTKYVYTNLVVGQSAYALPSDFMQVVRLEYVLQGSGVTAITTSIAPSTPNQTLDQIDVSGDPIFYTFDKGNIILKPVPNAIKELRLMYSYKVVDMTSDSDIPDVPDQFVEFISVLAARDGYLKDGRPIAPIKDKLEDYQKLLKQISEQRNIDRPRMITATNGGWNG